MAFPVVYAAAEHGGASVAYALGAAESPKCVAPWWVDVLIAAGTTALIAMILHAALECDSPTAGDPPSLPDPLRTCPCTQLCVQVVLRPQMMW